MKTLLAALLASAALAAPALADAGDNSVLYSVYAQATAERQFAVARTPSMAGDPENMTRAENRLVATAPRTAFRGFAGAATQRTETAFAQTSHM